MANARDPFSLSPKAEAQSRTHINSQRRIAKHLVVALVEGIIEIGVCGDMMADIVAPSEIHPRVAGGVIDRWNHSKEKVGVGAATHGAHSRARTPATLVVSQQCRAGVL